MSVFVSPSPSPRLAFALLALFVFGSLSCGGCEADAERTATVVIDHFEPIGGYPGVEAEVFFTITPGEGTDADGMSWLVNFGDGATVSGEGVEGEAGHAYDFPGDYEVEVFAEYQGEVVGSATETFRVYAPTDLAVAETRGAPANVRTGEELTVSFTVTNNTSSEVFTPYGVAVYLSAGPEVDADGLEDLPKLGEVSVEPDAEGEAVLGAEGQRASSVTLTVPDQIDSGDYYVVTVLDPAARIADTDPSNNIDVSSAVIRLENVAQILPDIAIEDLYVVPDRAFPRLNELTRGFTLANLGSEDAFGVVVKTYLSIGDDVLDPGDDMLVDTSEPIDIPGRDEKDLPPATISLLEDEIIPPAGEELEVWVIVVAEPEAGVEESDEDNNTAISPSPILVTDQPVEGADLVVRDFSVSPDSTFLNGSLQITTTVANEGTIDVGSFFCGIYLGDAPQIDTQNDPRLTNLNFAALASGEEKVIEGREIVVPDLYPPGTYYLYIVCDPANALREPFRSNNSKLYASPITITDEADVDIYAEALSVPQNASEGETVTLTMRVCVSGSNPSGTTIAELYRTPGAAVNYNAEPVMTFEVPNTVPGAENCNDVDISFEASCDDFIDTYAYGVALDADNRLPELDETNNTRAGDNRLTVNGTFCSCVEDAYEPNDRALDAVTVGEGTTSGAICTAGNCDFYGVELQAGDSLTVQTDYTTEKGRLVTTLYDPSGVTTLDIDNAPDTQQVGTFLVQQQGLYVFKVCGAQATSRNFYELDVDVIPQVPGVDVVPREVKIPVGDTFSVGTGFDVGVRVYNLGTDAATSFDAQVVVSADRTIDPSDAILNSVEAGPVPGGSFRDISIPVTLPVALDDGDYYVAVVLDPPAAARLTETDATNNVAFSRRFSVRTECYDGLEPNDSFATAAPVSDQSYSNLVACTGADDYYVVCPGNARRLEVTAQFDHLAGDVDLELYDELFQRIDASEQVGVDVERVSVDYVNGDQCYYVHAYIVSTEADVETTYSLDVDIQSVDPSLVCSSLFEPNDAFATASSLIAALNQPSTLDRCPEADSDYYYINLTAGQQVSFEAALAPTSQPGILRLQLYKPNLTPGPNIETAPGVPSVAISDYVASASGRHYLQLTVSGAQRNVTYTLDAEGLGGVDLAPADLVIGPGSYAPGEEIRFAFDLTNLLTDTATSPGYDIYYSTSPTLDPNNDELLGSYVAGDVAGSSTITVTGRAFLPTMMTGATHYLHVVVDPLGLTGDTNTTNNLTSIAVPVVYP